MTTLLSPLRRAVACYAEREAAVCGDVRLTYGATWERCRRLAGALAGLGLQRGDRVAVAAANSHQYLELYQTIPGIGMVIVPLNTRHAEPELRYALEDSGTRVLFTDLHVPDDIVERVVHVPTEYESLLAAAAPAAVPDDVVGDDLAGLFYTGGTTGAAKGVMLTHRNLVANALHLLASTPFSPDTRWLVAAPMFHAAGTFAVAATVFNGGCQVVLPAFSPGGFLDLAATEACTHTLVVPTMLAAIADEQLVRPRDVGALHHVAHGASPIGTEVLRRVVTALPHTTLYHSYGATETAPLATTLVHEELELDGPRARSCGRPVIGVEVEIRDGERACEPGEIGEVAIRGDNVMRGYWNKPQQTAAVLRDGWYCSGDLGYLSPDGCLFLVDRLKDMIVSGGENVYSTEVEEALYCHPAVHEVAVFGVPDAHWGEAVHAVVVPRPIEAGGRLPSADELIAHCRTLIAGYKVPKAIELRDEPLPKSGAGKILKRELREPFWVGHDGRIA
jgi:long-chain acyl-CoA synthetase